MNVCVDPIELIPNVVPAVPTAKVCVVAVSELSENPDVGVIHVGVPPVIVST